MAAMVGSVVGKGQVVDDWQRDEVQEVDDLG